MGTSKRFIFTAPKLDKLPARDKRYFVYDEKQPGLRMYITPAGTKTFQFQARSKELHKIVTHTMGKYPALNIKQAREQAAGFLVDVNNGVDIEAKKRDKRRQSRLEPKVKEFAVEYIKKYAEVNKKSWENDQRILNKDVVPFIGPLKMSDVKKRDIITVIDKVADRGSLVMANRVHSLLSKLFNYALERDVIEHFPMYGLKKRTTEQPRERVLSDDEIVQFWNELGKSATSMVLKMILVTGQRPGEVREVEWKEIQDGLWTIPSEKTKNGLAHAVPLTAMALSILEEMKKKTGADCGAGRYVFPGKRRGRKELLGTRCLTRGAGTTYMKRVVIKELEWSEPATAHDLRRTMRTHLSKMEIKKSIAERLLNHKERGISSVYDHHDYRKQKTAALVKWDNRLQGILTGKQEKKGQMYQLKGQTA